MRHRTAALAPAATPLATAGNLTKVAMAILVYGASALVAGAGLIGALRK